MPLLKSNLLNKITCTRYPQSNNKLRLIVLLVVLVLAIYPKVLTFVEQVSDPFLYSSMAVAQVSYEQNKILVHPFQPRALAITRKWYIRAGCCNFFSRHF